MKYITDSEGFYLGFGGDNTELSSGQMETPKAPPSNLVRARLVSGDWTEGATPEELFAHEDAIRTKRIMSAYDQRVADGWQTYQNFRAQMVKDIYDGKITKTQAFLIEEHLSVAYDKIAQQGDWETAGYKLSLVVLPPGHEFVAPYLGLSRSLVASYISLNYGAM